MLEGQVVLTWLVYIGVPIIMYPAVEEQGLIGDVHGRADCRRRHGRLVRRAAVRLAQHLRVFVR